MLLYLDNCCFNRPFDDQLHFRINLETQAKLFVQQEILNGRFQLLWSYVLEHENNRNPFVTRRDSIIRWKEIAINNVIESSSILTFTEELMQKGVKLYDALHIACANEAQCDYFLTVDKGLLNKSIGGVKIRNPIDFVRQLEV